MSKLILEGFIIVPKADLELIKAELPVHIQLTRNEPGCICFTVQPCRENLFRFNVYEEFNSQASFANHQLRVKASRWGHVTKDVQRYYRILTE